MKYNIIEPLKWDSQFFGYSVARILINKEGGVKLEELFRKLESKKVRLTYFFISPSEQESINHINRKGGELVDQKTVFSKPAEKHNTFYFNDLRIIAAT